MPFSVFATGCSHGRTLLSHALAVLFALASMNVLAESLDASVEQRVRGATFEIVVPKPIDDPLTYEKPLPMELLPYTIRTDKYFSIGTGFCIGPNLYATAGHVMAVGMGSQLGAPAIRDAAGNVYQIGSILKASADEDFVVFSLAQPPPGPPLEINEHPNLSATVFAVGNALGEGVVIRDGLYTSDTPEERDGRWKWLRFSAAASPGNSGGPLVDKDGKVMGIILAKSPNENLNYAVSMAQVMAAKESAVIDTRLSYQLDIFDTHETDILKAEFPLPKTFADYSRSFLKLRDDFQDDLLRRLLAKNDQVIFPNGAGSAELLHTVRTGTFPAILMKGTDEQWDAMRPQKTSRTELPHNGYLVDGVLKNSVMFHLRKPDDVLAADFYSDSRGFMDMVMKGVPHKRWIGSEGIRITSMGKAQQDINVTDHYQRRWQLRTWALPFEDQVVIVMALPVPDGYVGLMRSGPTSRVKEQVADMKALADFLSVAYDGTLAQWQEFLKQGKLLPDALSAIEIQSEYGHEFRYKSSREAFLVTPAVQLVGKNSDLTLDFSFFSDHQKTVWDVGRISLREDANAQNSIDVSRHIEPAESMNDSYQSHWQKLEHHQHPFDGVAYNDGDIGYIYGMPGISSGKPGSTDGAPLYTLMVSREGVVNQEAMKVRLDALMQGFSSPELPASPAVN